MLAERYCNRCAGVREPRKSLLTLTLRLRWRLTDAVVENGVHSGALYASALGVLIESSLLILLCSLAWRLDQIKCYAVPVSAPCLNPALELKSSIKSLRQLR